MNRPWSFHLKYPPTPEYAAQAAELMVESARACSDVSLDFSVSSLNQVDRIIRRMRREAGDAGQLAMTLFGFGCYVGEVFVRNGGGLWRRTEDTNLEGLTKSPMVIELDEQQVCDPILKVFKRFAYAREKSLPSFYQVQRGTLLKEAEEPKGLWNQLRGR